MKLFVIVWINLLELCIVKEDKAGKYIITPRIEEVKENMSQAVICDAELNLKSVRRYVKKYF